MEITQIVKELLLEMGFSDVEVESQELMGRIKIDIRTASGREIVGERGAVLACFQHIVRKVVAKKTGRLVVLDVDINNYKKMRENILCDFAKEMREKVRFSGKAIELEPMPSFDRRVIHLALAGLPDVTTESMGEGESRFVIVRPYP